MGWKYFQLYIPTIIKLTLESLIKCKDQGKYPIRIQFQVSFRYSVFCQVK